MSFYIQEFLLLQQDNIINVVLTQLNLIILLCMEYVSIDTVTNKPAPIIKIRGALSLLFSSFSCLLSTKQRLKY